MIIGLKFLLTGNNQSDCFFVTDTPFNGFSDISHGVSLKQGVPLLACGQQERKEKKNKDKLEFFSN